MDRLVAGLIVGFILGFPFGRMVGRARNAGGGPVNSGGEQKGLLDELKRGATVVLIFLVLFAALAVASRRHR